MAFLILPLIYCIELSNEVSKDIIGALYFLYLGILLMYSSKKPEARFLFGILSAFTILIVWPKTDKAPYYLGIFIVVLVPITYLIKTIDGYDT